MRIRFYILIYAIYLLRSPFAFSQLVDPKTPTNALPVGVSGDWALAFSDEFNTNSLDTTKWGIDVSTSSRAARTDRGIADWWWKSQNVSMDGSNVVLAVTKQDANTMWCGSISSDGKYEPKYGYIESRIQIADSTKDTHTAFWLQGPNMNNTDPADNTAYDGAEVDIFESAWFGDYTKAVVHIDGYDADHQASTKQYNTAGIHSGYHVFGLEWTADYMKIYYDGALKITYTGTWVPRTNEWIWLSVGASFGDIGTFTNELTGFLTSAKFDYVRVWQAMPPTYTVVYDGNINSGGSAPVDASTYTNGSTVTVLGNTGNLVRTGYTFNGWNTATNGSGTSYAPGATFMITTNVNLYAKWTANTYAVTFNANGGGTPSPTNTVVTYGLTYGTLATVTRTGYTFNGWFTASSGGTQVASDTLVAITGDQTLYAQWTQETKSQATVTLGSLSQVYDGTARLVSYTTSPTGLAVTITYNGGATAPTNAGNYTVVATIVDPSYQGSTNGTLVVVKAAPTVTAWPTASSIVIGQSVSNATLSGGSASVPGGFAYLSPTNIPPAGTYIASVLFTPTDVVNYLTVTESVSITIIDVFAVPFLEPFEARQPGDLNGQFGWVAEGTIVQGSNTFGGSAKAAQIATDGGCLRHTFNDARTKVWTDMRVKVVYSPEKTAPETNATAFVYVWTNAMVMAFNGTNAVSTGALASQGDWVRFTFFSDYAAKTYVLFVNDLRVGKYGFYNAGVPVFTELKVGGASTFVDDIGVTQNQPAMKYMPSLILLQ